MCVALSHFCYAQTEGFFLLRFYPDAPRTGKHASSLSADELSRIMAQPFTYRARGGQAFACVSADGKYVLKLFKQQLYAPRSFLFRIPLPAAWEKRREKKRGRLAEQVAEVEEGYQLAFDLAPEETALLCIHLAPDPACPRAARVRDKLGIEHELALDEVSFALQRWAEPLDVGDERVAELLQALAEKGLVDGDPGLHRNVGRVGERAVLFDAGKLRLK
jgi:hypothetical protein